MSTPITSERLAQFSLFKSIAQDALEDLAPECQLVTLQAGKTLFKQGEIAHDLYLIESGEVALIRHYDAGEEFILTRLGSNEIVGELSMIVGEERSADGIALQDSQLIKLDHDKFFKYLNEYPSVAMEMMVHLAKRLRETTLLVREWAVENSEARLASLILFLAERDGEIKTGLISSNIRKRNLARGAGVATHWLEEKFSEWENEGYIGLDGRRLLLHDKEALEAIAGWNKV